VELKVRRRAVIGVNAGKNTGGIASRVRRSGESKDLPMTGLDRNRIVGPEGRAGARLLRIEQQHAEDRGGTGRCVQADKTLEAGRQHRRLAPLAGCGKMVVPSHFVGL
jgi:hypothetical protein